jgi:hypothetical protein
MMLSEIGESAGVVLPHWSLNQTFTVFAPLPLVNVQLLVAVKALKVVQIAVLLTHICIGPPPSSVAVMARFTVVVLVAASPLLMTIVPVGGFVSISVLKLQVLAHELEPQALMARVRQ